jgi:xanthine dehydrogenase YagR molybdenum-binding subunit
MTTAYVGTPANRIDGRAKVTGAAKYAAEYNVPGLAYGYVVSGDIARGSIARIDSSAALALDGVLQVFTHENRPRLPRSDRAYKDQLAVPGSPFRPLYDAEIKFNGQPVALVVAETFELARYAATLIQVEYEHGGHATDFDAQRGSAREPKEARSSGPPDPRGDAEAAFARAAKRHEAEYALPIEHHNPMESFATTVEWHDDGTITVYEKTQGTQNSRDYIANVFGFGKDRVRVVSPYVGGAFGLALRPQYQLFLAVMAARELRRSVRVSLTRQQMFTLSYRPATRQRIALGADDRGALSSIAHDAIGSTSRFEDYQEDLIGWSGALYKCDNARSSYKLVPLDLYTPCDMRAPGGATGVCAIECAMDELAYEVGIDPLELRLRNYTEKDQNKGAPFSSKRLRECYQQGAERFGWAKRNPAPRSMREGNELIGWGVATGIWEAMREEGAAKAVLTADGRLEVTSAITDIGTGTYTIMTQIAADALGLPIADVAFRLGDSSLPKSPVQGGSWTAATIGAAVKLACDAVGGKLLKLAANMERSPFAGANLEDVAFAGRGVALKSDPSRPVAITDIMKHARIEKIEEEATSSPDKKRQGRYASYTHSAVFAEVRVDEEFGTIYVSRVVNAVAAGRILNPKTARSQILGGVVWGIGMALEEETILDHRLGRIMNHNLAEYHVPVNADVGAIDVIFVEEQDDVVSPIGVKGVGEIGIVGTAAAIANAVYHAIGVRVRDFPITLDKVAFRHS